MSDSAIIQSIRQITGVDKIDNVMYFHCVVDSVDIANRTCVVTKITGNSEITYKDVQLTAGLSEGIVITPTVGSMVYVMMSQKTRPFVVMYSDITSYVLMGGEFGGLVKVEDLTKKLNDLEKQINDLKTLFSSWVTVPSDGGASLKSLLTNWYNQKMTLTQRNDLENENVKHG